MAAPTVRAIAIYQMDANNVWQLVLLQPAASKYTLALNSSGVPTLVAASSAIESFAAVAAEAIDPSNMGDGSADNVLINLPGVSYATEAADIEKNFDKLADEVNALRTFTNELKGRLADVIAVLAAHNLTV